MMQQRRYDEVNVALLFNINGDYAELDSIFNDITDSLPESAWGL